MGGEGLLEGGVARLDLSDQSLAVITLRDGASLASLVGGLNALGVTPRDMISILQTIKAAGALQADIEVM